MFVQSASKKKAQRGLCVDQFFDSPLATDRVGCIILGGGRGTRLFPLTLTRCKPAISFGGRYRLIDVAVSNSLNAGIDKIFIVTQFLSSSLNRHLFQTYQFNGLSRGFIDILAAEQKPAKFTWFQGTADAVRQNLDYFIETPVDYFLILSGDQLYNLDFRRMLAFAQQKDADLTIAALPVNDQDAQRMGVLKVDGAANITHFAEKPTDPHLRQSLASDPSFFEEMGLKGDDSRRHLGSMGIYLFKRQALLDLLRKDSREDFGQHLIPTKVGEGKVTAYLYDGYWEDIGTIASFHEANLSLTRDNPGFNCYDEKNPIFTTLHHLPGPKIRHSQIDQSILCEGCLVEAAEITQSVLGIRSHVKSGTAIRRSYVMGNDAYQPPVSDAYSLPEEFSIGRNCLLDKCIVDKNVFIGNNVQLINKKGLKEYDGDNIYIRDGIIIVTRGAHIPDGFTL